MRMIVVVVAGLVILASAAQAQGQDQEAKIAKLVKDLASDDYEAREAADKELRKIGEPAVPALKKALEDQDAERADRARKILAEIEKGRKKPEEKKRVRPGMRTSYRDLARGVTFDLHPDGRVELTVPEENKDTGKKEYKTYKADSMDEFKEKYPDMAKKYEIDRFVPRVEWRPVDPDKFDEWFKDWRKRFDDEWDLDKFFKDWKQPFDMDELDRMLEDQRKRLEEWRRRFQNGPGDERERKRPPTPTPGGLEFGIKIEPVNETLAAQLDLKEGEGVQVEDVKAGSRAEKAGLKKHDVIVKLNGKTITDKWAFRKDVRDLLGKGFELEVFRGGKRETVKVKSEE